MIASPNCPKILLLLSSAHATTGGEQVITEMKFKWNKLNSALVIDYVCKFLLFVFYCNGAKWLPSYLVTQGSVISYGYCMCIAICFGFAVSYYEIFQVLKY